MILSNTVFQPTRRFSGWRLFLVLGILTFIATHVLGAAEHRALIIGIDGCRPDAIDAAGPLRGLDRERLKAAWSNDARGVFPTISGPCWASILCGVNVNRHMVVDNKFIDHRLSEYPSLFTRLSEGHPRLKTASIVAWGPINTFIVTHEDTLRTTFEGKDTEADDHQVTDEAVKLIAGNGPDLVFVHLNSVDHAGHAFGFSPSVPEYMQAIRLTDELVARIMDAVELRRSTSGEDWLVVLVTDHGGTGKKHGGNTPGERTVFIWLSGDPRVVKPGLLKTTPYTVDIAPTIAAHLGIPVNPAWEWEGTSLLVRP